MENQFQSALTEYQCRNIQNVVNKSSSALELFDKLDTNDQEYLVHVLKNRMKKNQEKEQEEMRRISLYLNFFHKEEDFPDVKKDTCDVEMSRTKGASAFALFPKRVQIGKYYEDKKLFYYNEHFREQIVFPESEECFCVYYTSSLNGWSSWARFLKSDWEELCKRFQEKLKTIPDVEKYTPDIFLYNVLTGKEEFPQDDIVEKVVDQAPATQFFV